MANHEMIPSTLNHGLTMCKHCKATDREIAFALGDECPAIEDERQLFANTITTNNIISFIYKNHKGITSKRRIVVKEFQVGATTFHPEPGFLLKGFCLDRMAYRTFKMDDIDISTIEILGY